MSWLILGKKPKARAAFEELLGDRSALHAVGPVAFAQAARVLRGGAQLVRPRLRQERRARLSSSTTHRRARWPAARWRCWSWSFAAPPLVGQVTLHARRQGMLEYAELPMRGDRGALEAVVRVAARRRRLHARVLCRGARRPSGACVARVASPERPIPLVVHGVPLVVVGPPPWYKRWYVWATVGAVVAGGAVAGVLVGTAEHAPKGSLPPGTISLGLRF